MEQTEQMKLLMYKQDPNTDVWTPCLTRKPTDTYYAGRSREPTDEDLKPMGLQRYCGTCAEQRMEAHSGGTELPVLKYSVRATKIVTLPNGMEFDMAKILYVTNVVPESEHPDYSHPISVPGTYTVCLTSQATMHFNDEHIPREELVKLWKHET